MSVRDCIEKLVKTGQISRTIGDQALALEGGLQEGFNRRLGPTTAEAAAAAETARIMAASVAERRMSLAKQAIAFSKAAEHQAKHEKGPVAGLMSLLVRDIWGRGAVNVDTQTEVVLATLYRQFNGGIEALRSKYAGISQNVASARNLVRELFGEDTGDQTAKIAAKGWQDATGEATRRAKDAGRVFNVLDDWRLPQFWTGERMVRRKEEWLADVRAALDDGSLVLWDKNTYQPAGALERENILETAFRNITEGGGFGGGGSFSQEVRVFRFQSADAYLRLMGKYGPGDDVFGLLTGHLRDASREIALAEVLGPEHRSTFQALLEKARNAEGSLTTRQRLNPVRTMESAWAAERTYDVLTGRANAVQGPLMAGIFGALRSLNTASRLGSAIVSAVTGDSATLALAANHNGIPAARLISGAIREMGSGAEGRALAARLNVVAHAAMDQGLAVRRFEDQIAGPEVFQKMASFVIRSQGLAAWTDTMKRVFTMEFLGHISDQAPKGWKALDDKFRGFLERYDISPAEWDALRTAPALEVEGARFFDTDAVADRALADKLMGGVLDERAYAVLEPDARVRGIMTGGTQKGTFSGELFRSVGQFKSFAMTMATTHMMRIAAQGPVQSRIWNGAAFVGLHIIAGAAAIQTKQMIAGRDPRNMGDTTFWASALAQSGGLGLYGDLLNSAVSRTGRGWTGDVMGPVVGLIDDVGRLASKQLRSTYEGESASLGSEIARFVKSNTPGSNLWFARLALDRLLWDQIQMQIDPDWRQSFRRMEKKARDDFGQEMWWRPGQTAPQRAPMLSAVAGGSR